jgi:hypothetical protein
MDEIEALEDKIKANIADLRKMLGEDQESLKSPR